MTFLELFDETLDINSTLNYELAVQAGPDGLAFCLMDTLRNKFVLIRSHEPDENKYFNSESIREIIEKDDFLTREYSKTRLIIPSSKFTLVPAALFDPAKKEEYFAFNHNRNNGEVILSAKSTDPEAFLVYSVPTSILETIRKFFPAVHPVVHVQPLLDYVSRAAKSSAGSHNHVHVERDYFNFTVFNENRLRLCNTYSYRNISDVIYYVMNAFEKLSLNREETLHFSGMTGKYDDLSSGFSMYVRNIKFSEPRGNFAFSYVFNEIELHRYLNLFSIFNCG